MDQPEPVPAEIDRRLYVPEHQRWTVRILDGTDRLYCHQHAPGQDYYHLIVPGEIYLEGDDEALCLNCALRRNVITTDRVYWRRREE
jgi:hypothetical protein